MYRPACIAIAIVVAYACDDTSSITNTPTVKLALSIDDGAQLAPSGMLESVSVVASAADDAPVSGITVSFAANATGVTFSPATAATDNSGKATSVVVVPYGTTIVATATSPGNGSDQKPMSADSLDLDLAKVAGEQITSGRLLTLAASATSSGTSVQGVSLTFSTNTSGVTIAPSPAITDANGSAFVKVPVQYQASAIIAQVSGGNAVKVVSLSSLLPALHVRVKSSPGIPIGSGAGSNYQVDATLRDAEDNVISGVPIAFSEYGVSANMNPFTPSSATTGSDGVATSFVTFAGTFDIVLTIAGVASACSLPTAAGSDEDCL